MLLGVVLGLLVLGELLGVVLAMGEGAAFDAAGVVPGVVPGDGLVDTILSHVTPFPW